MMSVGRGIRQAYRKQPNEIRANHKRYVKPTGHETRYYAGGWFHSHGGRYRTSDA